MQLRHRSAGRLVALAVAVVLTVSPLAHATPAPTTPEIEAKQAEAAAAQQKLDDLQTQLEMRAEEYAAITDQLQQTRNDIARTRAELEAADKELSRVRGLLDDRANGIYRTGSVGIVEVLLGTTSFSDFMTRVDLLSRIGRNDAQLVQSVKDARSKVSLAKSSLERRESEQIVLRDQADVAKRKVADALKEQKDYVAGLNAQVAKLIDEERKRQEAIAAELARMAAEEAAKRAAENASKPGARSSDVGNLGQGHPEVVPIALQFVGKVDYVYGGTTPLGFDCSGLTQYCYAQIGYPLPRTSRSQFLAGSHIPPDRLDLLVPGDLVFFGYDGDSNRVHHVGIYVGDGNFVHAPATGQKVTVSSLVDRIAAKGDYVGASRF